MEATLLDLSRRVENLEQKFISIQNERDECSDMSFTPERPLTPAERGRLLMERARRNAVRDSILFRQAMKEMGIIDEPTLLDLTKRVDRLEHGFMVMRNASKCS